MTIDHLAQSLDWARQDVRDALASAERLCQEQQGDESKTLAAVVRTILQHASESLEIAVKGMEQLQAKK